MYVVGVDLGQTSDPTAIVVVEASGRGPEARFDARHLERHLGKPYTYITDRVRTLVEKLAKTGEPIVGFDQTGVGRAVAEMLRAAEIPAALYGVTITAGDAVTREGRDFHVPKKDLVAALQVAFQNERIRIAKKLSLAELLTRELLNFRVKVTAGANETFEAWRAGDHDDFVLATAIAVWLYQRVRARQFDMIRYGEIVLGKAEVARILGEPMLAGGQAEPAPVFKKPEPIMSKLERWPPPDFYKKGGVL